MSLLDPDWIFKIIKWQRKKSYFGLVKGHVAVFQKVKAGKWVIGALLEIWFLFLKGIKFVK